MLLMKLWSLVHVQMIKFSYLTVLLSSLIVSSDSLGHPKARYVNSSWLSCVDSMTEKSYMPLQCQVQFQSDKLERAYIIGLHEGRGSFCRIEHYICHSDILSHGVGNYGFMVRSHWETATDTKQGWPNYCQSAMNRPIWYSWRPSLSSEPYPAVSC